MFSASKSAAPATAGGYQISNSLRFRSSASAYLNRTFGTPTNTYKLTFSFWMKRGILSAQENFLGSNTYPNYMVFSISSSDQLQFVYGGSPDAYGGFTAAVFRDPSAWYHIVYSVDTTQATNSNRVKVYVNGVQQTSISSIPGVAATYPPQNTANPINSSGMVNEIAATNYTGTNTQFFDGYMADINFIDGQALTPSSFGEYNVITGVWTPKSYAGTYGTNGFHLNFSNGTSTTTLGYDSSGNGNNWTTNNISLTAGATYDWMIDSPTSFAGSSYGVGNYCVLNPVNPNNIAGSTISPALSNGNLSVTTANDTTYGARFGSIAVSSGKWYFECAFTNVSTLNSRAGFFIANPPSTSPSLSDGSVDMYVYGTASGGAIVKNGSVIQSGLASYASGIIGVAIDLDALTCQFYINGSTYGNQVTGISAISYVPYVYLGGNKTNHANFGQRPFAYTPPSGFKSLCTYNLPTPTIQNGAAYMAATIWTGTGASSISISNSNNGVSFQPDFVWSKVRSTTYGHNLFDSVRGAGSLKELCSNQTGAEGVNQSNLYGYLSSFNSGGFTATAGSDATIPSAYWNNSGSTYVAWQWKAGGTAVTNNAGSITSSVSANTTAGFAVVTYTGNGVAGATVGHGLGVAPSMVIFKSSSQPTSWTTYHSSVGVNSYMILNTTDAATSASNWIALSSSVITQNTTGTSVNTNGYTYVAYCFAAIPGYSAFGSYTGNGSSDGPFVYCGFRPRYVLIKCSSNVGSWWIYDSARNTYNAAINYLFADSSAAEGVDAAEAIDFLSNGFKLRMATYQPNTSGYTFIYAAFAENPFQNALAR